MYDSIIIGSGPAGVTSALYMARTGLKVLIISKNQSSLCKAEKIENQADVLERNVKIFKRKLKIIVEQQMAVVDEIETLDLYEK